MLEIKQRKHLRQKALEMFNRVITVFFYLIAALVLSNTAFAKDCAGPTAVLEGGFSTGGTGMSYKFTQRMVLNKRKGSELYGLWKGSEYEQIMEYTLPAGTPPAIFDALRSTVNSTSANIPGVKAKCKSSFSGTPTSYTITILCKGDYPFEIKKNNVVYVQGGKVRVGKLKPGSRLNPGSPLATPEMSIDMQKGAPSYAGSGVDFNMTGTIHRAYDLGFGFNMDWILSNIAKGDKTKSFSEYELKIDVKPATTSIANSFKVNIHDWDLPKGTVKVLSQSKSGNKITLKLRLYYYTRKELYEIASKITVSASANPLGQTCEYQQNWNLVGIMAGLGITK